MKLVTSLTYEELESSESARNRALNHIQTKIELLGERVGDIVESESTQDDLYWLLECIDKLRDLT